MTEEFETMPVAKLSKASHGGAPRGPFNVAFVALPEGQAIFRPFKDHREVNSQATNLRATYRDRVIRSRIDREKGGGWYWWEPRL